MQRGLTGQYYVTQVAGETIRAFVPHPLPPEPPLVFSAQRQQLLERLFFNSALAYLSSRE